MPRVIDTQDRSVASLGDVVEALQSQGFDPRDEDAFAEFGPMLKRLSNDRTFLAEKIADELLARCAGQNAASAYGPQVILLHAGGSFAIRANIWPEEDHSLVRANGKRAFFYEVPHDHNVSFLTVGYAGPGYWSDYYEYDYATVGGAPGEAVALRHVERSCLSPGKVQLYRAHRDVHSQLPPDSLSISLNIMETSPASAFRDQYLFDLGRSTVAGLANPSPHEPLFAAAAALGAPQAAEILDDMTRSHASLRIRCAALSARASAAAGAAERLEILAAGSANSDRTVRALARAKLAETDALQGWIAAKAWPTLGTNTSSSKDIKSDSINHLLGSQNRSNLASQQVAVN